MRQDTGKKFFLSTLNWLFKAAQRKRAELLNVIEGLISNDQGESGQPGNRKKQERGCQRIQVFEVTRVRILEDQIETLAYEVDDAEGFVDHLRQSLRDFEAASETFSVLGHLDFEFCPSCFAPVKEKQKGHCQLCDTPRSKEDDDSRTLAVKLDLQMQLKESLSLQAERVSELAAKKSALRIAKAST